MAVWGITHPIGFWMRFLLQNGSSSSPTWCVPCGQYLNLSRVYLNARTGRSVVAHPSIQHLPAAISTDSRAPPRATLYTPTPASSQAHLAQHVGHAYGHRWSPLAVFYMLHCARVRALTGVWFAVTLTRVDAPQGGHRLCTCFAEMYTTHTHSASPLPHSGH